MRSVSRSRGDRLKARGRPSLRLKSSTGCLQRSTKTWCSWRSNIGILVLRYELVIRARHAAISNKTDFLAVEINGPALVERMADIHQRALFPNRRALTGLVGQPSAHQRRRVVYLGDRRRAKVQPRQYECGREHSGTRGAVPASLPSTFYIALLGSALE